MTAGLTMRAARAAALALSALALSTDSARAQAMPARSLSLAEALQIAERGNPAFRQVQNDVDVAEANARAAFGAYLPDFNANVNFNGGGSRTFTGEDDFGNPIEGGSARTIRSSSASQGLSLSMMIFDGGSRERRIGAAREQIHAAAAFVTAEHAGLRALVAEQYYRAQSAQSRLALEERLVAIAREQLDATQRRFGIAAANREDVLGSESQLATAEAQLETARGDARKAALLLRETLGLEGESELTLADSIPLPPPDAEFDADALVAAALGRHPSVAAADARAVAAERSAGAARGTRWPRISASAGFNRSDRGRNYGQFFNFVPQDQGFNFGLSTSIPLFDGFETGGQIASAEASAADARYAVRAERLTVEREVRAAVIDVENARRNVRFNERAAALSSERVELAQARYQAGALDFPQLQLVLDQAAQAERSELEARVNLAIAWVQLQEKTGAPVVP